MIDVFLERAATYEEAATRVPTLLERILPDISGRRVLIKPNFVAQRYARLACTHPAIILAAAKRCLELGARVTVGDAPAFGSAQSIARAINLDEPLQKLRVPVVTLNQGERRVSGPVALHISRRVLEADLILNLPKCKAHSQMRFSGAVKNLFGCVPGVRKAWLHSRHGDTGRFVEMLCGLGEILPPTVHLMDAVVAMHRTGPQKGDPFPLELLGASTSAAALDTALGMTLGALPNDFPIWNECLRRGVPGARPEELSFPLRSPADFPAEGFLLPKTLRQESFRPDVLARSLIRRIWAAVRSGGQ